MEEIQKLPQHKKVYENLRRQIQDGVFREGNLLPSENELCLQYNVTRPTVRQALNRLVNEGYITKHQGKGSIVNAPRKAIGILSLEGTTSSIGSKKLKTRILEKPKAEQWPVDFFFPLTEEEKNVSCIILKRQRIVENEVILYEITYLANLNLTRFTSRSFENKSLFDILRMHYQVEIVGGEQKIMAIPADQSISNNLQIEPGKPVLHLQRKMYTNKLGINIYSSIYCNTAHYYLHGIF